MSCIITMICAKLILEVRAELQANSYTDIGIKLFGQRGKVMVSIALALSQIGFTCAYVYFIVFNFHQIFQDSMNVEVNSWVFAIFCLVIFTLLAFVRKIQIFAATHIFADIMIVLTLIYIIVYGAIEMYNNGSKFSTVAFADKRNW